MGNADFLRLGDYNAVCYSCGKKCKAGNMRRHWQGFFVCERPGCWEPRQPQDFVRGTADIQTPPWTQPQPEPVFVPGAPSSPIPVPGDYPIHGSE
jgi:hypothetical protein